MTRVCLITVFALTLSACANMQQLSEQFTESTKSALSSLRGEGARFEATLPSDAIRARDSDLTDALVKVGRFAAKQDEPMTITVSADRADHAYIANSIRRGIPAAKLKTTTIETTASTDTPRVLVVTTREVAKQ